jgi:hypothetical protein
VSQPFYKERVTLLIGFVARITARRGNLEQTHKSMAKIYAYATPEQVEEKASSLKLRKHDYS